MVGVSHNNLARVKELLARNATLSLASWDWGFGDWEDALGAASHVGRPDIAEALLAHGARPSIFSAAMLGQLDVVKAFVAAVTFFPLGSLVRTNRDETGVVIRTNPKDPMHPVLGLVSDDLERLLGEVDTSVRNSSGVYERQVVGTLPQREQGVDLTKLLPSSDTLAVSA